MTNKKENLDSFYGYPLFNEIEDAVLRTRNRAVIMTNLLEDGFTKGKIKSKNALIIMGYLSNIDEKERKQVNEEFINQAKARGFEIA